MKLSKQLKGVNLGGWFSQIDTTKVKNLSACTLVDQHIRTFLHKEDIQYIKQSGFNHVRLPVDFQNFFNDKGILIFKDRLLFLEEIIKMILKEGLIVMLDLHECPGYKYIDGRIEYQWFFKSKEAQDATLQIWKQLSKMFTFDKRIYFEILNSPMTKENLSWDKLKNKLVQEVRRYAPEQTLIIGSNKWSSVDSFEDLTPIENDKNIIYNCHFFNPMVFTFQLASWIENSEFNKKREYPGSYIPQTEPHGLVTIHDYGTWNRERLKQTLQPLIDWQKKNNCPVICNEFGVIHHAPRDSKLKYLKDIISIFEEEGIGWTFWNYKNMDFGLISDGEERHKNLPQFQNPQRRDQELAELLTNSV